MIVRRGSRPRRYTVVDNTTIEDDRLTWEARGLLVFLLSKPDDWTVNRDHLAAQAPNGITMVRRVLTELEKFGYLERRRERGDDGKLTWSAVVYERPIGAIPADGSSTDGPSTGGQPTPVVTTEVASPGTTSCAAPPQADAEDVAKTIVDAFWTWSKTERGREPTLATAGKGSAYMALTGIVRKLLAAGWAGGDIKRALVDAPAYTINALTLQLNQRRNGASGRTGPRAPVVDGRSVPSGVVEDF